MSDFLRSTPAQAIIWAAVLVILVSIGAYVIQRFRNEGDDERTSASKMLTNFRELHQGGAIDLTEFKQIKTVLGGRLHEEFEDAEEAE